MNIVILRPGILVIRTGRALEREKEDSNCATGNSAAECINNFKMNKLKWFMYIILCATNTLLLFLWKVSEIEQEVLL